MEVWTGGEVAFIMAWCLCFSAKGEAAAGNRGRVSTYCIKYGSNIHSVDWIRHQNKPLGFILQP